MKDRAKYGIGAEGKTLDWDLMPWDSIEKSIRKLRQRIFRATREQKWNVVRSLMKLMLRSYLNLLVSVRRVTQKNKGKKTAGVDREVALTSKARMALVRQMGKQAAWLAKPTRRVYIPKPGKPGQERPLGIPSLRNRVSQAMVKNALEPCWEAQFESNSYGFRPGRSIHDAIEHCFLYLRGSGLRPWILDADIKGAFDNISHDHILKSIGHMPGRELVKQWLKAGYNHVVSKQVFSYVSSEIWRALWRWCLRRHPNKGKDWVRRKYFRLHNNAAWTFHAESGSQTLYLFEIRAIHIERHIKVNGAASPDDPALQAYWTKRRESRLRRRKVARKALHRAGSDARAG